MTTSKSIPKKNQCKFISDRVNSVSPSGIRKFFDLLATMKDVISLGVGEPDYTTPWHIREAAIYSLEKGNTMYTSNRGTLELRHELAKHLESFYGLRYDPETELQITVGVSEGLDISLRAVLNPGDEVIMADPCYVSYPSCTILAGGDVVSVPTYASNNFELNVNDIEERITPRTKALLLGFPSNPTGAVMPREKLQKIADLAIKHDLLVISDEIYSRLIYGYEHTCIATLPGMKERTILLNGFSKAYAMTGWRIGYIAANKHLIEAMMKIHQYIIMCAPIMSQTAALEALREGEGDVAEMVADYDQRRRVMVNGFNRIGLPCFEPKGAFYTFPSIKATGMTSEVFAEKLLFEEKVAVVPGTAFGHYGEGHVRCCYATSLDEIKEAINRIERFIQKHHV